MPLDAASLTSELKAEAERLGFSQAAACPAVSPIGATRLGEWLHLGYGGEMDYIGLRQQAYADPAETGKLSELPLQERGGIDNATSLRTGYFGFDDLHELFEPLMNDVVIIGRSPGIA